MDYKKIFVFVLPLFLCFSCLHSRTGASSTAVSAWIKITYGNAAVKIDGKINEDLYYTHYTNKTRENKYHDPPAIAKGSVTKNEIRYLGAGDEYKFSILPTEVVTINIISTDGDDVEATAYQQGRERKYTAKGANKLGIFIAFQNR
ncbi:MAG: hypothetical protein LBT95_04465 [Treponema sp.]|nr:hypothetical protein [Treponema sp.]